MKVIFKKMFTVLLSFVMLIGVSNITNVNAASKELSNVKLTSFNLTNKTRNDGTYYNIDTVYLDIGWDATSNGKDISNGDFFVINLPKELDYSHEGKTTKEFTITGTITNEDGTTQNNVNVAKGVINPTSNTLTVTFNNAVEGKYNIKGQLNFGSEVSSNANNVKFNQSNTLTVSTKSNSQTQTITINRRNDLNERFVKTGSLVTWRAGESTADYITQAQWYIKIKNPNKNTYQNVKIEDSMSGFETVNRTHNHETTSKIIANSFMIYRGTQYEDANENVKKDANGVELRGTAFTTSEINNMVTISDDGKSFTIDLGTINDSYYISYRVNFDNVKDNALYNEAKFSSTTYTNTQSARVVARVSEGYVTAAIPNRIKILKADGDDQTKYLKGATFEIYDENKNLIDTKTTGEDGMIVSDTLTPGTYYIKEVKAPVGYELYEDNEEKIELTAEGIVKTVENYRETTSIEVTKHWDDENDKDGIRPDKVIVYLLANGVKVDERELTSEVMYNGDWYTIFENVNVYDDEGNKIEYTIEEVKVDGYESKIVARENGYTITNTHKPTKEKTTKKVKKVKKVKKTPKTGDTTNIMNSVMVGVISFLVILVITVLRKKFN